MSDRHVNAYQPRQPLEQFSEREKFLIRRAFNAGREFEASQCAGHQPYKIQQGEKP